MTLLFTIAIIFSAALTIITHYAERSLGHFIFKPLTTLLIILLVLITRDAATPVYKYLILTGLLFSLAGDIFLMLPQERFLSGLLSFLVAHIVYLLAFVPGVVLPLQWWPGFFVLVFITIMLRLILPGADRLKVPVVIYTVIIGGMVWIATERLLNLGTTSTLLAAVGAVLFVASDSVLAVRKFMNDFPAAQGIILSTYFAAQLLIALSV